METLDDRGQAMGLTTVSVGSADYNAVAEWLYREAAMLDAGDFDGWLALLATDIVYEMPTRQSVLPRDGDGFAMDFGFFAENYASLETRIRRLGTEQAWAEQPGSRTRHIVNNLLVDRDDDGDLLARCAFFVTRIRSDLPYDLFTGERRDTLRPTSTGFELARRTVLIDQTVLKSYNLSFFF
jgi:3-phenylpropionate/cinnamic acid dioxygenase small subunit